MSKLLLSILLLSSILYAQSSKEIIEDYLEDSISQNPNIESLQAKVTDTVDVAQLKGWKAYVVELDATLKKDKRKIKQKMIWFSNGKVITKELTVMKDGLNLSDLVKPKFRDKDYKAKNLISGNKNAKHKVALFSDPLCPFCREFVPGAIEYMQKQPSKFAVYYYNFPLPAIHPASITLVKAEIAAELKGHKDLLLKLYKVKINPREKDEAKILAAFNDATGLHLSAKEINAKAVIDRFNADLAVAESMMVQGTPTMFFDGVMDKTKKKFKQVK